MELEPDLKRRLYSALALQHQSLKDWFIGQALEYLRLQQQPRLFAGVEQPAERRSEK